MKLNAILPMSVVVVAIAISTVLQGKLTDRWPFAAARTEKLEAFSERLDDVPIQIGPWKGEEVPLDVKEFKASNCDKGISRAYRNETTGEVVNVYLVSGVARHVTIHTPDWCYRGAGFAMEDDMEPYTLPSVKDVELLSAGFRKEDVSGSQRLRIFWGYSDDGHWRGPRQPKPEYAGRPALYKIYLITDVGGRGTKLSESPALAFAEVFMPLVNKALFPDVFGKLESSQSDQNAAPSGEAKATETPASEGSPAATTIDPAEAAAAADAAAGATNTP